MFFFVLGLVLRLTVGAALVRFVPPVFFGFGWDNGFEDGCEVVEGTNVGQISVVGSALSAIYLLILLLKLVKQNWGWHHAKAWTPIVVTLSGMLAVRRFSQPWKADVSYLYLLVVVMRKWLKWSYQWY